MGTLTTTVLTENALAAGLRNEHGLSLHIRYRDLQIVLDFGQSDAFALNAETLGLDLAAIDFAVLSHAHYDHANGMGTFFARNGHAPLYLSERCGEKCWSTKGGTAEAHYIGIGTGLLERYRDRLDPVPTACVTTIAPGVHLVPHRTPGLAGQGEHAGMLQMKGDALVPDDFAHEMSLVLELDGDAPSLAVFSSCSHAGLPVIAREVADAFPEMRIAAFVGGLHLVHASDDEILQVAKVISAFGIERLYTGHCTGAHAFELLAAQLPGHVLPLCTGSTFVL